MLIKSSTPIDNKLSLHAKIMKEYSLANEDSKLIQMPLEISARIVFNLPLKQLVRFSLLSKSCYKIGYEAYNYFIKKHYKRLEYWKITLGNKLDSRNYIYPIEQIHISITNPLFKGVNTERFNKYCKLGLGAWIRQFCINKKGALRVAEQSNKITIIEKFFLSYYANDLLKVKLYVDIVVALVLEKAFMCQKGLALMKLVLERNFLKAEYLSPKHFKNWLTCINSKTLFFDAINVFITLIERIELKNKVFINEIFNITKNCYQSKGEGKEAFQYISIRCIGILLKKNLIDSGQIDEPFLEKLNEDVTFGKAIPKYLALWMLSIFENKGKKEISCLKLVRINELFEIFSLSDICDNKEKKAVLSDLFNYAFKKKEKNKNDFLLNMQPIQVKGLVNKVRKKFVSLSLEESDVFTKSMIILKQILLTEDSNFFNNEALKNLIPRVLDYIFKRGNYSDTATDLLYSLWEKYPELRKGTEFNSAFEKLIELLEAARFEGKCLPRWEFQQKYLSVKELTSLVLLLKKLSEYETFSIERLKEEHIKTISKSCSYGIFSPVEGRDAITIIENLVSRVEVKNKHSKIIKTGIETFYENLVRAITSRYKETVYRALEAIMKSFFTSTGEWKYEEVMPMNDTIKNIILTQIIDGNWYNRMAAMHLLVMLIEKNSVFLDKKDEIVKKVLKKMEFIVKGNTEGVNGYRYDEKKLARQLLVLAKVKIF